MGGCDPPARDGLTHHTQHSLMNFEVNIRGTTGIQTVHSAQER
jgi:hypothetical protein